MSRTKELLAVLDMDEEEQLKWLINRDIIKNHWVTTGSQNPIIDESLADLAFRMRDEAVKECDKTKKAFIFQAFIRVYAYSANIDLKNDYTLADSLDMEYWVTLYAQPIHWIIAALIVEKIKFRLIRKGK